MLRPERPLVLGFSHGLVIKEGKTLPSISDQAMIEWLRKLKIIDNYDLALQGGLHGLSGCVRPEDKANVVLTIDRHHESHTIYVDMNTIAEQGGNFAIENGYKEILILTFPILGWQYAWYLVWRKVHQHGIKTRILWRAWHIPSDPESAQWWTTRWYLPVVYGVKRQLTGIRGK